MEKLSTVHDFQLCSNTYAGVSGILGQCFFVAKFKIFGLPALLQAKGKTSLFLFKTAFFASKKFGLFFFLIESRSHFAALFKRLKAAVKGQRQCLSLKE